MRAENKAASRHAPPFPTTSETSEKMLTFSKRFPAMAGMAGHGGGTRRKLEIAALPLRAIGAAKPFFDPLALKAVEIFGAKAVRLSILDSRAGRCRVIGRTVIIECPFCVNHPLDIRCEDLLFSCSRCHFREGES